MPSKDGPQFQNAPKGYGSRSTGSGGSKGSNAAKLSGLQKGTSSNSSKLKGLQKGTPMRPTNASKLKGLQKGK